jgi:hypothetical protein
MMRSTGSRGGAPGKYDAEIKRSADMFASCTFGCSNRRANQRCGAISSLMRSRAASIPISHAVMGDIYTAAPASFASLKASTASAAMRSAPAIQITAQVSSR